MKSLRYIVTVLLISQLISGCIATMPPSYRESNQETIMVIYEPYPVPIPERPIVIIINPIIKPVQPIEKPEIEKYRIIEEGRSADRNKTVASPNKNERIRNSGERNGR